jgi:hypothetical protein
MEREVAPIRTNNNEINGTIPFNTSHITIQQQRPINQQNNWLTTVL